MWEALLPLMGAGVSAVSNYFGAQAQDQANQNAIRTIEGGTQQEVGAIQQGERTLQGVVDENAPGQAYLRQVVAGSGDLTPEQKLQLADINRTVTNQIDSSSLAGSGRSAAALIDDASNRFRLSALDANRQLAFGAAGTLAGNANRAQLGQAADQNTIGAAFGQQGMNIAKIQSGIGATDKGAITGTGSSTGAAIGNIGSIIAKQNSPRLGNMEATAPVAYPSAPFSGGS